METLRHAGFPVERFGFAVVDEARSQAGFGNAYVILQNNDMRVRLVKDRSQLFLDIGPLSDPNTWWDMSLVRRLVGAEDRAAPPPPAVDRIVEDGGFIHAHYTHLKRLLQSDVLSETSRAMKALARERAQQMFPDQFIPPT